MDFDRIDPDDSVAVKALARRKCQAIVDSSADAEAMEREHERLMQQLNAFAKTLPEKTRRRFVSTFADACAAHVADLSLQDAKARKAKVDRIVRDALWGLVMRWLATLLLIGSVLYLLHSRH